MVLFRRDITVASTEQEKLSIWLEWLESGDGRFRDAAVKALAARHALQLHEDPATCPLTSYGIASCAASVALVLTDTEHPNHWSLVDRLRREAGSA